MLKSAKDKAVVYRTREAPLKDIPPATAVRYALPPLEFNQPVKDRVENILALLNRPLTPEAVEFRNRTSKLEALVNPPTRMQSLGNSGLYGAPTTSGLFGAPPAPPAVVNKNKTLSDHLRVLVDEWLDSGFFHSSEMPKKRNFESCPNVAIALFSFSRSGKLLLLPYGHTPSLHLDDSHLPFTKKARSPVFDLVEPLGMSFEEIAHSEITFILLSDLRVRLAKCRNCSTYFLLKHWNRTYSHGTKCEICKRASRSENSVRTTASVRADAYTSLYQKAAKKFRRKLSGVPAWHKEGPTKAAIAAYLSPYILRSDTLRPIHPKGITGKWTAQPKNWQGINNALNAASVVKPRSKTLQT